jgi:alkylhydroperoxidase family enzyme
VSEREPRLAPLPEAEWDDVQRPLLERIIQGPTVNIYATLARNPEVLDRMTALGRALRGDGLTLRHREVLILRTGWNCRSSYEFAQHRRLATQGGMTDDDLRRIVTGPDAPGWDPFEAALCRAADEIHRDNRVGDSTWATLAATYDDAQLVQAVALVGYYHLVSFTLNTLGTPLEPGARGYEDLVDVGSPADDRDARHPAR